VDREVEGWLRGASATPPSPGFAAEVRQRFLAGELAGDAEAGASLAGRDARSADSMIEDLLKAGAPLPPARAAFRDALRPRFVRGALAERIPPAGAIRPGPGSGRSPALRLVLGVVAAAAALWVVARLFLPDEPAWRGFRADGPGPVALDGREFLPRDLAELGGAFQRARTLESRERRLELVRDDELVLVVLPGSRIEMRSDGSDGELRYALLEGEVYLKTKAGYRGPAVVVETDDMDMRLTGTVVGVLKNAELSCICVARGTVRVQPRSDEPAMSCGPDSTTVVSGSGEVMNCPSEVAAEQDPKHVGDLRAFSERAF
jgi:ferric-dicitrate binding protein FerR (iron transport regulator)